MSNGTRAIVGLAILFCIASPARPVHAGPCSDQIADIGRKLAQSPSLGPPTTGTLTGSNPGSAPAATPQPAAPSATGTSAGNRLGGTAATKEVDATAGNLVATSPQDVRRQQEGKPTAAAVAARNSDKSAETRPSGGQDAAPNDRMSEAKVELERARMLDHSNDATCKQAIERTQQLMN